MSTREMPLEAWVQCTSRTNVCLGGCRSRAEHERYSKKYASDGDRAASAIEYVSAHWASYMEALPTEEHRRQLYQLLTAARAKR